MRRDLGAEAAVQRRRPQDPKLERLLRPSGAQGNGLLRPRRHTTPAHTHTRFTHCCVCLQRPELETAPPLLREMVTRAWHPLSNKRYRLLQPGKAHTAPQHSSWMTVCVLLCHSVRAHCRGAGRAARTSRARGAAGRAAVQAAGALVPHRLISKQQEHPVLYGHLKDKLARLFFFSFSTRQTSQHLPTPKCLREPRHAQKTRRASTLFASRRSKQSHTGSNPRTLFFFYFLFLCARIKTMH